MENELVKPESKSHWLN